MLGSNGGVVKLETVTVVFGSRPGGVQAGVEASSAPFLVAMNPDVLVGEGCLERLRGMFAFAVWDAARETLFLARDHLEFWRLCVRDVERQK